MGQAKAAVQQMGAGFGDTNAKLGFRSKFRPAIQKGPIFNCPREKPGEKALAAIAKGVGIQLWMWMWMGEG